MKKRIKKKSDWLYVFLGAIGMLICVVIGVAAWTAVNYPVFASVLNNAPASPSENQIHWAQVEVDKPSVKPVVEVLPPQAASTPTPEAAIEPSLVPTDIPTFTPTTIPTEAPTSTPEVTETPGQLAMEVLLDTPTPIYVPPPTSAASDQVYASTGNGPRWIDVDLTHQMVYAYEGDVIVNSFLVSTGTWKTPTVTGKYKIYQKIRSDNMHGPGYFLPDVPYIMYFYKGYGLHGTYWHNNFGTPMSHGCVNLRTADAGWIYNWASIGTVVKVHY